MIYMNSVLEKQGHRLFQPIPLRTSIVPKHITLNTSCLVGLFFTSITKGNAIIKKSELIKNVTTHQVEI